jgi:hypothetical protein
MRSFPSTAGAALALAILALFVGCRGPRPTSAGDLLAAQSDTPETMSRTMECLKKDAEGNCLQNQCKEGPGGATFDCGSFGKACVDAGLHWKGTKQGGVCSVPGHQ